MVSCVENVPPDQVEPPADVILIFPHAMHYEVTLRLDIILSSIRRSISLRF